MPVLLAKATVASGATSAWVGTDGTSNIIVGVSGEDYSVEFDLGSDLVYQTAGTSTNQKQAILVTKANQVRVQNKSADDIEFEVFG